jgi:mono/diheme cytochrome c family protein
LNRKQGFAVLFVFCVAVYAFQNAGPARATSADKDMVARGEYLVNFGGCNDCHSPKTMTPNGPAPDPARLLSGYTAGGALPVVDPAMVAPGKWILFNQDLTACIGPWGVTYAANLTPDDQTGIGLWTPEVFIGAMRSGKHMGKGRPIQMPMPWWAVGSLSDEDLNAIFAYLKSLPPIKNPVPANLPLNEIETSGR